METAVLLECSNILQNHINYLLSPSDICYNDPSYGSLIRVLEYRGKTIDDLKSYIELNGPMPIINFRRGEADGFYITDPYLITPDMLNESSGDCSTLQNKVKASKNVLSNLPIFAFKNEVSPVLTQLHKQVSDVDKIPRAYLDDSSTFHQYMGEILSNKGTHSGGIDEFVRLVNPNSGANIEDHMSVRVIPNVSKSISKHIRARKDRLEAHGVMPSFMIGVPIGKKLSDYRFATYEQAYRFYENSTPPLRLNKVSRFPQTSYQNHLFPISQAEQVLKDTESIIPSLKSRYRDNADAADRAFWEHDDKRNRMTLSRNLRY